MNTLRRSRSGFAAPQRRSMPLWLHVLAMVGVAVSVLLGLLWLLTSDRTSPLSATPNDQTLLEVIRLAFYAVAGIGGVVALTVAYRRQRISEAAENREDTKLFNERFAAAAEQLASERAANRIAGVYALAALADDWDAGRQTCVNVLCAYLRMPYEPPPSRAEREEAGEERFRTGMEERLIRHTVVNVIAERLRSRPVPGRTWHECDFNFNGATLDNCNFRGVLFKGTVSFANASFPTGAIVFSCAHFQQDANFRGATISGARVYFDRARFTGAATFGEVAISGGALDFRGAEFEAPVLFFGALFTGGEVRFDGIEGEPGASFAGAVSFAGASFAGSDISFHRARLEDSQMDFRAVADRSHPPDFDFYPKGLVVYPDSMFPEARAAGPDVARTEGS